MEKVESKLDRVEAEVVHMQETIGDKNAKIRELEKRVMENEIDTKKAVNRSNHNEQYSRKTNFKILGVEEEDQENTQTTMKNTVSSLAGVKLSDDEIMACHRIPGQSGKARPILVKLRNAEVKSRVMRTRSIVKKKGQAKGIRFVDDVTRDLYKSKEDEICDIDLAHLFENSDIQIPKLDRQISDDLEREITEAELLSTLKNMKNNKSPGSDGYTAEFFKFFWKDLSTIIVRAVNDAFLKNQLPISQRLGIISCLPKGDKPRQYLKNWRPITLLNVFYKLISGCLSQRIKSTLDQLISSSQTGFLSGRYIGENTRLLYDIMSYTECNDIPGLLVLIDFEKAFDSIAWSFVYKVLNFFGFGQNLINWIKIMNTDIKASVVQSGFLSEQINIQRGCRQGDPVAPYIFLLCAEILSLLVKQNTDIKGIVINRVEHKISQYP